jgi:tetratricopeptide (TPR) repeat protein
MAAYHHYAWEWEASEAAFRRSIEARPSYATAHQWLAELLIVRGQLKEAVAEAGRARDLDPLSLAANLVLGLSLYHARDYDGAIVQFRHTLELDPAFVARGTLWLSLIQKGRYDEAVREYAKTLEAYGAGPERIAEFQRAYQRKGIRGCWQWLIDTGISLTGQTFSEPYYFATYHSLLGQNGEALDQLDKALAMHSGHIGYIATDPALDGLRGEPRFRAMLAALHLAGGAPPAGP